MANKKNTTPGIAESADSGVMHNPQPSRARTHVRKDGNPRSEAAFAAWRTKTVGGNFDLVREAVQDAVNAFSDRQPEDNRRIWLKVANEIGYETFRDLYLEQVSIMRECKLRNPSAAFQNRLNRYTNHSSHRVDLLTSGAAFRRPVCLRTKEKPGSATGSLQENCASESMYDIYENAKNMTMDEAYAYCRELEEKRQWSKHQYSQGHFESSMQSYDSLVESFEDPSEIAVLSDGGKGAKKLHNADAKLEIAAALKRLSPSDSKFVRAVLDGKDWREMGIPKRTFNRRLKKVENF